MVYGLPTEALHPFYHYKGMQATVHSSQGALSQPVQCVVCGQTDHPVECLSSIIELLICR